MTEKEKRREMNTTEIKKLVEELQQEVTKTNTEYQSYKRSCCEKEYLPNKNYENYNREVIRGENQLDKLFYPTL